ncbi:MAG: hypothetical protein CVV51_12350 [Spirochaetae bacterium HGW-Spirochaetae-7]|jgi:23S rRNA pseudouridine1911/1915/1917 synthase|nr:MAG: hypothetical protein CVV51_12350 [Spirochaetae bacterium HGW-Spirochaetae-7]
MHDPFEPIDSPRIVFDDRGVVVVAKPAGMHCAPDGECGTLCSWLFGRSPSLATVHGRKAGEGGLLHRLDAATSGLVAFAGDDASFIRMAEAAGAGDFVKSYRALGMPSVAGLAGSRPEAVSPSGVDGGEWASAIRREDLGRLAGMMAGSSSSSFFRPFGPGAARVACASPSDAAVAAGQTGKAWTRDVYTTDFESASIVYGGVQVECRLSRGFRHQVRAHMAWLGLPLGGDGLYGEGDDEGGLRLRAFRLSFPDPRGGMRIEVSLDACL